MNYNKKTDFYNELYVLHNFLNKYNLKLRKESGEEFNFSPIDSYAKLNKGKPWFDKWNGEEEGKEGTHTLAFKRFFEELADTKVNYPKATFSFLNNNKFSVVYEKEDTQVQLNYNKDHICIDPTIYSPTCKDLENTYRQHFTPNQEVEEEKLMDLFEENSNKKLHENWRDKLMGVCFS